MVQARVRVPGEASVLQALLYAFWTAVRRGGDYLQWQLLLCPLAECVPLFLLLSQPVNDEFADGSPLHYLDPSHGHNLTSILRHKINHIATNISTLFLNALIRVSSSSTTKGSGFLTPSLAKCSVMYGQNEFSVMWTGGSANLPSKATHGMQRRVSIIIQRICLLITLKIWDWVREKGGWWETSLVRMNASIQAEKMG